MYETKIGLDLAFNCYLEGREAITIFANAFVHDTIGYSDVEANTNIFIV